MNLQKYSERVRGFLQNAQTYALGEGNPQFTAEHVLKGYLSAFADGDNVTVVYVWDVLDNAGGRLHRIQGKESVPGRGSDAWAAVPATTMQEIGVETIAEYMKWKQAQG